MNDRGSFVDYFLSKKMHRGLKSSPIGYSNKNVLFSLIIPEEHEAKFLAISGLWRIKGLSESLEEHQRALYRTSSAPTWAARCKPGWTFLFLHRRDTAVGSHPCPRHLECSRERAYFHPTASLLHVSALLTNSRNILSLRAWSCFNI